MPDTSPALNTAAMPARWFFSLLLAATVIGGGLRLYKLDTGSFWLDELYTVRTVHSVSEGRWTWTKVLGYIPFSIGLSVAGVDAAEIDPADPSGWRAAGVTELTARLPAAVLGIASIPILGLVSRRLLGDRGAIMVALLLAVSPWHIYWSQAARFYVLQFLLYDLSLILYFTATRTRSRARLVLALGAAVLAFSSQPTSVVLAAIFATDWIVAAVGRSPGGGVRLGGFGWAAAVGAASLCAAMMWADHRTTSGNYFGQTVQEELHHSPQTVVLAAAYLIWPSVAVFAACAGVWLWRSDRRLAVYLGAAAIIPIVLFAALSTTLAVGSRYTFIAAYAWLALAALGLEKLWTLIRPRAGLALAAAPAAALVTGMLLATVIAYRSHGNLHARWREAVEAVEARRQPGEPVYASTPYIASYYLREPALPLPRSTAEVAAIDRTAWIIVENSNQGGTSRYWLLPHAELIDYFGLRAPHSDASTQVYRHTPAPPGQSAPVTAD
jgi:mannosyltransferase